MKRSTPLLVLVTALARAAIAPGASPADPPKGDLAPRFARDVAVLASRRHGRPRARHRRARPRRGLDREARCARCGLPPAFAGSYRQPFDGQDGRARSTDGNALEGVADGDWTPLGFSSSGAFAGELAFVGYGIEAPPARLSRARRDRPQGQGRAHAALRAAGEGRGLALRRQAAQPLVGDALQGPPGARARRGRRRLRHRPAAGRGRTSSPRSERRPGEPGGHPGPPGATRRGRGMAREVRDRPRGASRRTSTATCVPRSRGLDGRARLRPRRAEPTFAEAENVAGIIPGRGRAGGRGRGRRRALRSPRLRRPGLAAPERSGRSTTARTTTRPARRPRCSPPSALRDVLTDARDPPHAWSSRSSPRRRSGLGGIVAFRRGLAVPLDERRGHDQPRHGRPDARRPARGPRRGLRAASGTARSTPSRRPRAEGHGQRRRLRPVRPDQLLRRRSRCCTSSPAPTSVPHARRRRRHAQLRGRGAGRGAHGRASRRALARGEVTPAYARASAPLRRAKATAAATAPTSARFPTTGDGARRRAACCSPTCAPAARADARASEGRPHRRDGGHAHREPLRHDLRAAGPQARRDDRRGRGRATSGQRVTLRATLGARWPRPPASPGASPAQPAAPGPRRPARRASGRAGPPADASFYAGAPRARASRSAPASRSPRARRAAPHRRPPAHVRRRERRGLLQPRREAAHLPVHDRARRLRPAVRPRPRHRRDEPRLQRQGTHDLRLLRLAGGRPHRLRVDRGRGDACPAPPDRSQGYVWAVYPTLRPLRGRRRTARTRGA